MVEHPTSLAALQTISNTPIRAEVRRESYKLIPNSPSPNGWLITRGNVGLHSTYTLNSVVHVGVKPSRTASRASLKKGITLSQGYFKASSQDLMKCVSTAKK
jgi:hypothetical protein